MSIDFRVNYDDGNEFYGPRLWVDTLDTETGDVVHKTFYTVPTAMRLRDRLARALRSIPAEPADAEAFRAAFWSDPERAAAERSRMAEVEGGAPVEVDDPAEIQRRLDVLTALPSEPDQP